MKTPVARGSMLPTRLGRQSVWLELAFVVMFAANILVNIYLVKPDLAPTPLMFYKLFVLFMLACGLAGGALGVLAVTKQQERSPLVWVAILCGLFVLLLVLNELAQGIQYMLAS